MNTTRGIDRGSDAYAIRTVRDERYRLIWNLNFAAEFNNLVTYDSALYLNWSQKAETNAFAAERFEAYRHRPEFELYDMEADPWSLQNLADDPIHHQRITTLHTALKAWMTQQGDQGLATEMSAFDRMPARSER
jgi:N-sulfoglucosamine sulfohydrolase